MNNKTKILIVLWLFQAVNYLDRVAISFAGPSIMKSLAMEPKTFGMILSSFTVGYFIAQIPGGVIADRLGAKALLVAAPICWAMFTGITGLVAGVTGFVVVRACLGLSEGLSNTSIYKIFGEHFNSKERTSAFAIWATAIALGPAFAGPLIGSLLGNFQWQVVFQMLAAPALMIAILAYRFIPAMKSGDEHLDKSDSDLKPHEDYRLILRKVLQIRSLWVISAGYFGYNIAYWGYLGWMPSYLASAHGIDVKSVGLLGGIPYVLAFFGLIFHGWLGSSVLYRKRPHLLAASYVLAAAGLFIAYSSSSLSGSLAGLSVAAFFMYGGLSCFGAILTELAPVEARATYSGICNTIGQIGGSIAPISIGFMVSETGSFASGFTLMVVALCIAACCMLLLIPAMSARFDLRALPCSKANGQESIHRVQI